MLQDEFTIEAPFDSHCHFRQGEMMQLVVPWTARHFETAQSMPNTTPPLTTGERVVRNRDAINAISPELEVVMTMYLTPETTTQMIEEAAKLGVKSAKAYFRNKHTGAAGTTGAHSGLTVEDLGDMRDVFIAMRDQRMILNLHLEVPHGPYSQRERLAIAAIYQRIREMVPGLVIIIEHVSDRFTLAAAKHDKHTALGITPMHLTLTYDHVCGNHHNFFMPIAKSGEDVEALVEHVVRNIHPRTFAGTDTAPHLEEKKNSANKAPAGSFSAPAAISTYVEIFERHGGTLDRLEAFLSQNGRAFYGLVPAKRELRITRRDNVAPEMIGGVVPFRAGETLPWSAELVDA